MRKESVKKSANYALIPLGIGAGQYLADLIAGERNATVFHIAIFSILASLVTFAILMVFFPWWESKRSNLGESSPVPVYQSPILWVPLTFVAIYLVNRIANA